MIKRLSLAAALLILGASAVFAAPTDIVPQGAALNDYVAALAARGYLGDSVHPNDFTADLLHTRAQLAKILKTGLIDCDGADQLRGDASSVALADLAVNDLRSELIEQDVDIDALLSSIHLGKKTGAIGYTGTLQPEERIKSGGTARTGSMLIYRAVTGEALSPHWSWTLSASNWAQDWRRNTYNDVGAHSFQGLNEGYIQYSGGNGLEISAGRMFERWGPAMRGAELISDNVPAYDEIKVAFPFSLGAMLGKNWRYTQFASTFNDYEGKRYFEGRRIEYEFSQLWNVDYEEAFKSSYSGSLAATPMPFLVFKGTNLDYLDSQFNYNAALGLNYSAGPDTRLYTQYFIDDFRSPLAGDFLGLSLGHSNSQTPRRIGYLFGASTHTGTGTSLTVEYAFADPTSNVFQNNNAAWERGLYSYIGMPNGPNTQELSGVFGQDLGERLRLAVSYRNRLRHDNSFPEPASREISAGPYYKLDSRQSIGIQYVDYRQDPFTAKLSALPVGGNVPLSMSNYGTRIRTQEVDATYQVTF
ncbi:MAG: hypothetical protein P4L33_02875 [Capsulimonadaceae bacterium]|nr:hypothetical protein [Capsulimonadaceae bacterium]